MKTDLLRGCGLPLTRRHALAFLGQTLGGISLATGTFQIARAAWADDKTGKGQASGVMLATDWQSDLPVQNYLVSEKLDGVRAIWDGQRLRFRSGRDIVAPGWFLKALPPIALDGELWIGRGTFDQLSGIVRRNTPIDEEWAKLRYWVFDAPRIEGTFEMRHAALLQYLRGLDKTKVAAVEQTHLADSKALQTRLLQVTRGGGEGLVLHRADSVWSPGRSDQLRKLKVQKDDEARVLSHQPGKGKFEGLTGALWVENQDGKRFSLGSGLDLATRKFPPAIGSVVTYRYRGYTPAGIPRFASFLRVRGAE